MSAPKIPYPPSPTDVPEGLTDYSGSYVKQQNRLLAGLFAFLIFYVAMVIFFAMVGVWCFLTLKSWPLVKMVGLVLCSVFFLFLVKGFFKGRRMSKETNVEITEDDHPILFGFIQNLCEEIGAPFPNRVFLSPDVNAACSMRLSLVNLFVEPKKDLLIGLGLVNCMNLSEFKAVLAHEFGHFCQSGQTSGYTVVVQRIIGDLVTGEDWFDRVLKWCKKKPKFQSGKKNNGLQVVFWGFAMFVGWLLDGGKAILLWLHRMFALQDRALSREQEFHADKVAVSAAGSDASTHGLLRARFGMQCFSQAVNDLIIPARDHKLFTNDLYLHQDRAAEVVRRSKKEPELGLPPALLSPNAGKKIRVFDAEQDELEDQNTTPPMWRTHPADADREENAKGEFVAAVMDHRSPWILFTEPAALRERLTYKFYRLEFGVPKDVELTDAIKVQEYIDNERADTTYDPKYHGAYDNRHIYPGDVNELNAAIRDTPWTQERIEKVFGKLYEGCREHAEEFADLVKERESRRSNVVGKPSAKLKKMIEEIEEKIDAKWEWFKSFDRRVYLLHVQMADQVDRDLKDELIERYKFQAEVQRIYQEAQENFSNANLYFVVYLAVTRGQIRMPRDFGAEVIAELRKAWKSLKKIIQTAREINLPAMKNFEEAEQLADFILDGKMVPEPPLSDLKFVWVDKLISQLRGVRNRCSRLQSKSVGGILVMQEKIAARWLAARAPVAAEVISADVVAAEEVVAAELLPDDVVVAEVLPDDVVPADLLPAAQPEPAQAALAAFVGAPPAPPRTAATATPPVSLPPRLATPAAAKASSPAAKSPPPRAKEPEPLPLDDDVIEAIIEEPELLPLDDDVIEAIVEEPAPATKAPKPPTKAPTRPTKAPDPLPIDVEVIDAIVEEPEPIVPAPKPVVVNPPAPKPASASPSAAPEPVATVAVDNPFSFDPTPAPTAKPAAAPAAAAQTDNPFSFDPTPASPATAPVTEAKLPDSTVAETFALDAARSAPPSETDYFSLDVDAEAKPAVAAKPAPAPKPVPKPAPPVEEVFSLDSDADAEAAPAVAPKAASAPEPIPIEDILPLDLDADQAPATVVVPKPATPRAAPAQPTIPVEEVFTLDADAIAARPPVAAPAPVKPSVPPAAKPTSGTVPQPAAKAAGSGTVAQPAPKPVLSGTTEMPEARTTPGEAAAANGTPPAANPKRPAVKITFVRPGEKSPFGK